MPVPAIVASALLAVIAVFQLALAAGAPWGAAAWGGQHPGTLPRKLRIASGVVGIVVYPLIAVLLWAAPHPVTLWSLAGFFGLGALANLASRSRIEKLWAPVAATLAVCLALLARG